jgi:hypothetical protein
MKKSLMLLIIAMICLAGCSKKFETADAIRLEGGLEKPEMTTYQYGTHLLKTADKTYALGSKKLNLDLWIGKVVSIKGIKVKGYPLEGGPELIEVSSVN